jgi:ABC-type transport system involved in multi-copper enzyme maturation permease subunit
MQEELAPWYVSYVLLFNMLVGPVFSAGSVTSERERQTLDLLLTTVITPWQILWGKLFAGLRVSSVLTMFLVWPIILAAVLMQVNWPNWLIFLTYIGIIVMTCISTATIALFCSVVFHKTAQSLLVSYLVILALFCAPLAITFFAQRFFPESPTTPQLEWLRVASPVGAAFDLPLKAAPGTVAIEQKAQSGSWLLPLAHIGYSMLQNRLLLLLMIWLFHRRWRVAE